jgi:hypothetical protein
VGRLVFVLLAALPLYADALSDVRSSLARLGATTPIRATFDLQRNEVDEGKFSNDKVSGHASVDLEADGAAVKLVVPRPLLAQIGHELDARAKNPDANTPTERALDEISTYMAAEALDGAPPLIRLMEDAKVVSDGPGTWGGKPVRVVILRLSDKMGKTPGKVSILENRLTLWLGPDHVPLAAEHIHALKFSFLVFKSEQRAKRSWHYARSGDRLVRARYELTQTTSGMGQKGTDMTVATVKVTG